jgi:hypothetical protein
LKQPAKAKPKRGVVALVRAATFIVRFLSSTTTIDGDGFAAENRRNAGAEFDNAGHYVSLSSLRRQPEDS